jgi:hypothetical protein
MRNFIIKVAIPATIASLLLGAIATGGARPAAKTYAPVIGGYQTLQPVW